MLRLIDFHPEPLFHYILSQENDFILQQLFNNLTMDLMSDLMLKLFMCDIFEWDQDQAMLQTPLRKFMMKSKSNIELTKQKTQDFTKAKKENDKSHFTYFKVAEFWLEQNVLERCLAFMRPEYDEEIHITIQYLLSSILKRSIHFIQPSKVFSKLNPLAQKMMSKEFVDIYIRTILNFENSSVISSGVELLSNYISFSSNSFENSKPSNLTTWPSHLYECLHSILNELPSFVQILNNPPTVEPLQVFTTFGILDPPLGEIRLKVIEFLSILFQNPFKETSDALIQHKVLQSITTLFFKYEFNNLLHNQFLKIISYILSRDSLELQQSLFKDCKIIERILAAHRLNEESCAKSGIRKGYMGHLITISNTIVTVAKSQKEIQSIIESEDWQIFVENDLAERNLIQTATLGGSHPMSTDFGDMNEHFKDFDDEMDENEFHNPIGISSNLNSRSNLSDDDDDFSDDSDSTDSSDDDTVIRRRDISSDNSSDSSSQSDESPMADESPLSEISSIVENLTETFEEISLKSNETSDSNKLNQQDVENNNSNNDSSKLDTHKKTFSDLEYWNSSDLTAFDINL